MATYKVTTELKTPWWLKLLRFFHIKKKREWFEIAFHGGSFSSMDLLKSEKGTIKIIGRKRYK